MARSNRQLTQFAVNALSHYLGAPSPVSESAGNTSVNITFGANENVLTVSLFNATILELGFSASNHKQLLWVSIGNGGFFDGRGNPSRTTRERLNGLLDCLGTNGYIPEKVRAFILDDVCYIGNYDGRTPLTSAVQEVQIVPNPVTLEFIHD